MIKWYREDLTPDQVEDVQFIKDHVHFNAWISMGGGKTVTTLTAIRDMIYSAHVGRVLIVAPLRVVLLVWEAEARIWSHLNHLKFSSIRGTPAQRRRAMMVPADIYLVNYENLVSLSDMLIGQFLNKGRYLPFSMVVYDESSKMKNLDSKRVKALLPLTPYIERRGNLTGTPATNGLEGVFSQQLLCDGGLRLGMNKTTFLETYFVKRVNSAFEKYDPTELGKEMIYKALSDMTIVRKGTSFPTSVNDIWVQLSPKLMEGYLAMEAEMLLELMSGDIVEINNKGVLFGKAQQYVNGAMYTNPDSPEWEAIHDEKLSALEDLIEGTGDEPILLTYLFQHDIARIKAKFGDIVHHFHGGLSDLDMIDMAARWNRGELKVLAGHAASMGHGLNMQFGGHQICWYGLTPNLELYDQFNARLPRRGQKNDVIIHRILARDTVDELVITMLENKAVTQDELKHRVAEFAKLR